MFSPYNIRPEVDNDVISGTAVYNVAMNISVQFGDYRSNGFGDIQGADFERTNEYGEAYPKSAKGVSAKHWLLPSIGAAKENQ